MPAEVANPSLSYLEQRILLRSRPERRRDLLVSCGLLLVVLAAHGTSLWDGLFLEDHWHRAVIRTSGWGLDAQRQSATFDLPGQLAQLWWQEQPLHQSWARPVAMLILKIEYHLVGGSPVGLHAFGLLWHTVAAILVFHLARWMMLSRGWSFLAGTCFALNPHSAVTASWISAQAATISTCFLLGAVLAYAAASAVERTRRSRRSHRLYQIGWVPVRIAWLATALVLWLLAVLSFETAIIFPILVIALDAGYGRWPLLLYRLPIHAAFWSLSLAYAYWRLRIFPGTTAPQMPLHMPADWSLVPWAAYRLVQLGFSLVSGLPMFASGFRMSALTQDHVALLMAMALPIVLVLAWYEWSSRTSRCRLLWPVWALAGLAVTLPLFTTPMCGYLPFAGFAIMLALMLSRLPLHARAVATGALILAMLVPLTVQRRLWRGVLRSEQLLYADVPTDKSAPQPGGKVFFINLPLVGLYAPAALREIWNMHDLANPPDLEGHILTLSPHPLMMDRPCVVEQTSDDTLIVSLPAPGYFAEPVGRMLLDCVRPHSPLTVGTVIHGEVYDTTILEADESGIQRLKFTFVQPLESRHYHFYLSSSAHPLHRLRFDRATAPIADAHRELFVKARSGDATNQARQELVTLARPIAIQQANPIQAMLSEDSPISDENLDRLELWWASTGTSELLAEREQSRGRLRSFLAEQQRALNLIRLARTVAPVDLFLQGRSSPEE